MTILLLLLLEVAEAALVLSICFRPILRAVNDAAVLDSVLMSPSWPVEVARAGWLLGWETTRVLLSSSGEVVCLDRLISLPKCICTITTIAAMVR